MLIEAKWETLIEAKKTYTDFSQVILSNVQN